MYIQSDQDFQYFSLQQLTRHSISGQQHNDLQNRNSSHDTSQHSSSSLSSRPKKSKLKNFLFGGSGSSSTGYGSHGDINSSRNMNRGFPGSPSRSKRPLKCPILQAPDYLLDPHIFIESYVEVESQYLGILKDVQRNFPMSSRQTVLTTIDRAKQRGQLPYTYQPCDDVIISLSIHNIKILRRDSETLLLRVFLHEIDSIGMASDCAVTYVLLKVIPSTHAAKRSSDCRLVVLKFVSSAQADETCALFKQLFATLFSESAVRALTPPMKSPQFLNGSSNQNTPMENSPAFQMLAPDSSRNSSIALETSVASGPEIARFSRPTSILMPDIPKSSSLFYDSPPQFSHYSPVPRPDYFSPQLRVAYMNRNSPNIFSSPQQYHHQRAFSDAPHRDNALQSRLNASSTPRRESSFIMNQNGTSSVQSDRKFLEDIHKILTPDEVKQFNSIIYAYLFDNGSIDLFIQNLGALLGAERMHIMSQLGKFLPVLKESNQLHALLSEQVSNMEGDVSPREGGRGDGRGTDGEVRSGNESSSLSSHSLNLNEQTPSGQRNGHNKMPTSSAESQHRGGARSKEPSNRQKDISGVIENRKNVMSYCSSSSSSCSFSASNETQQQLPGSNERSRGKSKVHKPTEPSGKYYPNSVANADRKTSAGGITLNENGRVKPKKRAVESTEDNQNETETNNDQMVIPKELLELDSMLAQMAMSSPPTTLGGSNGLVKERTAKSEANSSDCENENKTLEAPTNTNSALSSNQNSSYTLNSSTYIKSSGSEKSAKKPNKVEPSRPNNQTKPHEMKNSPPRHLKQMFEPPGNDL